MPEPTDSAPEPTDQDAVARVYDEYAVSECDRLDRSLLNRVARRAP